MEQATQTPITKLHEAVAEERQRAADLYQAIKEHAEYEPRTSSQDKRLYAYADKVMGAAA